MSFKFKNALKIMLVFYIGSIILFVVLPYILISRNNLFKSHDTLEIVIEAIVYLLTVIAIISIIILMKLRSERLKEEIALRLDYEKKLKKHENFLLNITDNIPAMIGYWDRNLVCQFANKNYNEWFGKRPQEVIGFSMLNLLGANLYELNRPHVEAALRGEKQVFERYITRPNNEIRCSLASYIPDIDETGAVLGFYVLVLDISELKKIEIELRIVATAFESKEAIIVTDANEIILKANKAFFELSGYKENEIIGKTPRIFKSGRHDTLFYQNMWKEINTKGYWQGEVWDRRKDGKIYPKLLSITAIKNVEGVVVNYVSNHFNLSKQKAVQNEILKAREVAENAARAKSEFLANMSHEIRTPMNSIIGYSDLLKETNLDKQQKEFVEAQARNGQHLLALIDDILDLSKIETGNMEIENVGFKLNDLLQRCAELSSGTALLKFIKLSTHIDPSLPLMINGDPLRIRQSLVNLVSNAIKFTPPNGEVIIKLEKSIDTDGVEKICFRVIDNGIGISKEKLPAIFERFSQADNSIYRKYGGSGLGLTISKHLITMMGGEIQVESTEGQGSIFSLILPLRPIVDGDKTEQEEKIKDTYNEGQLAPLKVLIVDDSIDNRQLLNAYISKTPCQVDFAENGEVAFFKNKIQKYNIVLMDIQMPVMDGFTATRLIREWERINNKERTPIISLTANALKEEIVRSIDAGCDLHLTKPIKKNTLIETIIKYARP